MANLSPDLTHFAPVTLFCFCLFNTQAYSLLKPFTCCFLLVFFSSYLHDSLPCLLHIFAQMSPVQWGISGPSYLKLQPTLSTNTLYPFYLLYFFSQHLPIVNYIFCLPGKGLSYVCCICRGQRLNFPLMSIFFLLSFFIHFPKEPLIIIWDTPFFQLLL